MRKRQQRITNTPYKFIPNGGGGGGVPNFGALWFNTKRRFLNSLVKDEDSSVEYKLHCTNNSKTKQFREHQLTRFDAGDSGGAELSDTKLMA